jgi:hypothetical protein
MFVERVQAMGGLGVAEFKESDFETLARNNLNGRQVRFRHHINFSFFSVSFSFCFFLGKVSERGTVSFPCYSVANSRRES